MRYKVISMLLLGTAVTAAAQMSVRDTRHNLSVTGPGTVRAASESRICIFCHTPHDAAIQAPLWNRADPGGVYEMYWSPTMDAYPSSGAAPQPNGSTKLCLSCHDGTIAVGSTVAAGTIPMTGGITTIPTSSRSFLGSNLSGDHPVSFTVTDSLVATNNAKGDVPLRSTAEMRSHGVIRLDDRDRMQCTTCHDPHDDTFGDFLVTASVGELCTACHVR